MQTEPSTTVVPHDKDSCALTATEFHTLAEVPAEVEWFANLRNANTKRAYQMDIGPTGGTLR